MLGVLGVPWPPPEEDEEEGDLLLEEEDADDDEPKPKYSPLGVARDAASEPPPSSCFAPLVPCLQLPLLRRTHPEPHPPRTLPSVPVTRCAAPARMRLWFPSLASMLSDWRRAVAP